MISESGLIKIPQDMLKKITDESHLIFLSYAYHVTRLEASLNKYHNMVLKMLKHYELSPIDKHMLNSEFSITFDDSDLPKSYNWQKGDVRTIVVKIDPKEQRFYGYYQKPNFICLCTNTLYSLIRDPQFNEDMLFEYFKRVDYTIEHELTHFMQFNYLHPDNSKQLPGYSDFGVEYYQSQVEFDPTIKSDLGTFAKNTYLLDRKALNEAIKYFVGSSYNKEYDFRFEKSPFFLSLRMDKDKERYYKAVKLFAARAREEVRDYLIEHTKIKETEADRLDYAFGKLRLNEFADLVKNVNTFINYPESRQLDFKSIEKYLPKLDKRFMEQDTKKLIFVPCGDKMIDYVLNKNKGFIIKVIFSNPNVEDNQTGLMFEFGDLPLYLNINILTRDLEYIERCEDYDLPHLQGNFVIANGEGFTFNKSHVVGVYKNGKKV